MNRNRLLGWLVIAGAAAAAVSFAPTSNPPEPEAAKVPSRQSDEPSAPSRLAALPERETIGKRRGEAFAARSWTPPPSRAPAAAPVAAPVPLPPPMPYRVAGQVVRDDGAHVVLAKGDAVLAVREGDTLEGGYRVESIAEDRVTLRYLPLGVRHELAVASTLGLDTRPARTALAAPEPGTAPVALAGRPAQLRWEGPKEVRAGATFDVALKVTSAHPVRASPLQLGFDAKLLEPVDVRAGGFFADGMFSYRVNRAGSIFVGASGKGAVATDAEIVVVTFRPIRPGATAELTVSSLLLQGTAGRAIVHDRPAAFRTTIVQ
ncbi:MAG TPA: cohesin domain-containing protein [Burkholderiales bacterium]|nr:cohesin domain-containing protein [Burkholderiales bacterium]